MVQMPLLPYSVKALEPYISRETLECHFGKHLLTYVSNLNQALEGTLLEDVPLMELIRVSNGPIFENAAQVWNHDFFFHNLLPDSGEPSEYMKDVICKSFGSLEDFRTAIRVEASLLFGSGWLWVLYDPKSGKLKVTSTANAETPLRQGEYPIMTIDLWEHSYYLDYKNDRSAYVDACLAILNWKEIEKRYEQWKYLLSL